MQNELRSTSYTLPRRNVKRDKLHMRYNATPDDQKRGQAECSYQDKDVLQLSMNRVAM